MNRLVLAIAFFVVPLAVLAQDVSEPVKGSPGPPKKFLDWLAPGQYVGVVELERCSDVRLYVYTDIDYQSILDTTKLKKKGVKALQAARENFGFKRKLDQFVSDRSLDQVATEKLLVFPRQPAIYAKIVSVGDDFVTIQFNDAKSANPAPESMVGDLRILPQSKIASIDLHVSPISFSLPTGAASDGK